MPFADVNDVRMYYGKTGNLTAPPHTLLGGSGSIDARSASWTAGQIAFTKLNRTTGDAHSGGRTTLLIGMIPLDDIASAVLRDTHPCAVGLLVLDVLERNSSAQPDVSRT